MAWPRVTDDQIKERFMASFIEDSNGCWRWQRTKDRHGYAKFSARHKWFEAHRWSYEMFVGAIPKELVIDHLCRVVDCVNPKHLETVTILENTLRGNHPKFLAWKNGTCTKGHPRSQFNKFNQCKECYRARARRYYHQKKERV